jgi:hypothetical protein
MRQRENEAAAIGYQATGTIGMSRTYIPAALRQQVFDRATGRCEYCRFPQQMSFATFECEHIVAEKHGGATTADNLALACPFCNRFKGTDLGSLDPDTGQLTPFFHRVTISGAITSAWKVHESCRSRQRVV